MIIEGITLRPYFENAYILGDERTRQAIVVDPGAEPERVLAALDRQGLTAKLILCTHAHIDHIGAVTPVRQSTGALFAMSRIDYDDIDVQTAGLAHVLPQPLPPIAQPDRYLEDGDLIEIGDLTLRVLFTPGHTRGHLAFAGEGILISGDLLFRGSIGRFDLFGGNPQQLLQSIRDKVLPLPDATEVRSGHGPLTTVGHERANNRYILEMDRIISGELAL
ncbi:MAG: MBL fold metallo-hydrolase [Dehalococcoidia bacterium]|nr:MBL fold metallo-hydrolase [Dehalococcoidia bacterium]